MRDPSCGARDDRPAEDGYFQDKAELLRAVVAHQADMVLAAQQPQLRPERRAQRGRRPRRCRAHSQGA